MRVPLTAGHGRRRTAAALTGVVVAGALSFLGSATARADSAPADPANPATPPTVSADALPTVQMNGVAWAQVVVGNTVYVAGKFTRARPAGAPLGTQETVRDNLLAYDVTTGALIASFAPDLNAQALALAASPDGRRIYVGGDFTQVNGQVRNRIAALDPVTGALVPGFAPSVSGQVHAIAATGTTVYLGGSLTAVGTVARNRVAAVSASTGALLPWAPSPGIGSTSGNTLPFFDSQGQPIPNTFDTVANSRTNNSVMAMVVTGGGSQVVLAGRFDSLNGQKATGVGAVDPTYGTSTRPFAINRLITNQGNNSAVDSLSTDGTTVWGTGYDYYGPGDLEGAFSVAAAGGTVNWISDTRGDHYSNYALGGALYVASHTHDAANIGGFAQTTPDTTQWVHKFATALSLGATGRDATYSALRSNSNFAGQPAPSMLDWYPTLTAGTFTGQNQAGWSVSGNGQYVVYGGEFPKVNGVGQQGLVRFALPGVAGNPNRMGPSGGGLTPTLNVSSPGTVRVSWTESSDQDNQNLTYRVYRDNGTTPVYETVAPSTWYDGRSLSFFDRGVSPAAHTYRVAVADPLGNKNTGAWASVTVPPYTSATVRPYAAMVRADGAEDLWSLGDARGSVTAADSAGPYDLAVNSGVTLGQGGAVAGDGDTAASFNGSTAGFATTTSSVFGPDTLTVEAWFQTTTTAGGKIVGFGNATTGNSTFFDRHVWMQPNGTVSFGVWNGALSTVTSPAAYNDGRWHQVTATLGSAGIALYLDGRLVATKSDAVTGQPFYGYWRIGGDASWTGANYFAGRIDEVAVYPTVLAPARIAAHWTAGSTGQLPGAPTASFTATVDQLSVALDGTASTAAGRIVSWAWAFGDGTTGSGPTVTHTYTAGGTYPVTLTVTDDQGATASRTDSVTVKAPPPDVPPTARFTVATSGRSASFDGSTSSDSDGSVVGWAWDLGDGATATGATVTHQYAADGTYTVTLTATDDKGLRGTASQTVRIQAGVVASDAFARTVTGGLGTADIGGPWTPASSVQAARQSVSPGSASFAMVAGTNTGSSLASVAQTGVDLRTTVSLSAVPTGGWAEVHLIGRQVSATEQYRARLRVLADGSVRLALLKLDGSATAVLLGSEVLVPNVGAYTAGAVLHVHLVVAGTGTTSLAATVWADGAAEPAAATLTATDSSAALQVLGALGLNGYLSGSATAAVTLRFGALTAVPA